MFPTLGMICKVNWAIAGCVPDVFFPAVVSFVCAFAAGDCHEPLAAISIRVLSSRPLGVFRVSPMFHILGQLCIVRQD